MREQQAKQHPVAAVYRLEGHDQSTKTQTASARKKKHCFFAKTTWMLASAFTALAFFFASSQVFAEGTRLQELIPEALASAFFLSLPAFFAAILFGSKVKGFTGRYLLAPLAPLVMALAFLGVLFHVNPLGAISEISHLAFYLLIGGAVGNSVHFATPKESERDEAKRKLAKRLAKR